VVAAAAGCAADAAEGEAVAAAGWNIAGVAAGVDATATEASWITARLDAASGIGGAGFKTSAARVGPAATTTNPTRGRTARVRREPAEGRSTILRGLAPAMEGGRLVRQSRESG
jgi:hypothetical protein